MEGDVVLAKTEHGPTKIEKIIDALIMGGEKAVHDFYKCSGGEWFDEAPEYLLTSYAVMSIKNVEKTHALLEVSVDLTRKQAGATRRGRPASAERRNGRFDIVLYWANGNPRGVVEVKSPISINSKTHFHSDFTRICKTINANCDSSFQFGIFLFYASVAKPKKKYPDSSRKIEALFTGIKKRAYDVAKEHNLDFCLEHSQIHDENNDVDGAWSICAIIFTRKGGATKLVQGNHNPVIIPD
jgi:hypothetical protein